MHNWFQKDKPFFVRCNATYSHKSRNQTEQNTMNKRDNKQPIGKQHADNQSEEDTQKSHRGGKGEKEEETEKEKRVN